MPSVVGQWQSVAPAHRGERKFSVEVREQRATPRRLPLQPVAEGIGIDGNEDEVVLASKPLGCGFHRLLGGQRSG